MLRVRCGLTCGCVYFAASFSLRRMMCLPFFSLIFVLAQVHRFCESGIWRGDGHALRCGLGHAHCALRHPVHEGALALPGDHLARQGEAVLSSAERTHNVFNSASLSLYLHFAGFHKAATYKTSFTFFFTLFDDKMDSYGRLDIPLPPFLSARCGNRSSTLLPKHSTAPILLYLSTVHLTTAKLGTRARVEVG